MFRKTSSIRMKTILGKVRTVCSIYYTLGTCLNFHDRPDTGSCIRLSMLFCHYRLFIYGCSWPARYRKFYSPVYVVLSISTIHVWMFMTGRVQEVIFACLCCFVNINYSCLDVHDRPGTGSYIRLYMLFCHYRLFMALL